MLILNQYFKNLLKKIECKNFPLKWLKVYEFTLSELCLCEKSQSANVVKTFVTDYETLKNIVKVIKKF